MQKADAMVVFGNTVERSGVPSKRLAARLNRAEELYKSKFADVIIVSGGLGKEGYDEAKVMKDYLVAKGIPAQDIIEDNTGNTTYDTAKNTQKILKEQNKKSVILVSQYYHLARAKLAFRKVGIGPVFTAPAKNGVELRDPYSLLREFVGYYAYLFRKY